MIKLSKFKSNPNNPRVIRDEKFEKLKKSITEFPAMMALRPIIYDENNIVLGGNMRLRALQDLGYKEVSPEWVKAAKDLTEEEKRKFIISDNVAFGEWDWDVLANEWDSTELKELGVEVWDVSNNLNELKDSAFDLGGLDLEGTSKGQQRVVFIFDNPIDAEKYLNAAKIKYEKRSMAWQVNMFTQST